MENLSTEIVGLIYQLLPGFIAAWVFYGLTSYIKPSAFDQIVQALIFTVIVKVILITTKSSLIFIGNDLQTTTGPMKTFCDGGKRRKLTSGQGSGC